MSFDSSSCLDVHLLRVLRNMRGVVKKPGRSGECGRRYDQEHTSLICAYLRAHSCQYTTREEQQKTESRFFFYKNEAREFLSRQKK